MNVNFTEWGYTPRKLKIEAVCPEHNEQVKPLFPFCCRTTTEYTSVRGRDFSTYSVVLLQKSLMCPTRDSLNNRYKYNRR